MPKLIKRLFCKHTGNFFYKENTAQCLNCGYEEKIK